MPPSQVQLRIKSMSALLSFPHSFRRRRFLEGRIPRIQTKDATTHSVSHELGSHSSKLRAYAFIVTKAEELVDIDFVEQKKESSSFPFVHCTDKLRGRGSRGFRQ